MGVIVLLMDVTLLQLECSGLAITVTVQTSPHSFRCSEVNVLGICLVGLTQRSRLAHYWRIYTARVYEFKVPTVLIRLCSAAVQV